MKLSHLPNMKLVIFDFDGTIADTSAGIVDAHRYTLQTMGLPIPVEDKLRGLIGGNLLDIYTKEFGLGDKVAKEAVKIYRERYARVGIHKATLYPGLGDILEQIKDHGIKIGVATLKAEIFAKTMLIEMGIETFFDYICGMDMDDKLNKTALINNCMELCGCSNFETVLIGDSTNDLEGAKKADTCFIGVTYGFGFSSDFESTDFITVSNPDEIANILLT